MVRYVPASPPPEMMVKEAYVVWSRKQVEDLLKSFDMDKDGKLSKQELQAALNKLGSRCVFLRVLRALRHADSNKDGLISIDDHLVNYLFECLRCFGIKINVVRDLLVPGCINITEQKGRVQIFWSEEQLLVFFKSYDKDGDGGLTKDEAKAAFDKLGSRFSTFRTWRARCHADTNSKDRSILNVNDLVKYALKRGYKL
ncbi:hypothetical protein L3X38_007382 [Prunus dulcis]|uniref:EF-hand domain-containing protein n=1 Tax=Prunus dulcis TaxID=3755 RepID=A0AAD4ZUE7_PRUDU|nr:hypothetical protein L3X38_007382 [Prunus dulcis]